MVPRVIRRNHRPGLGLYARGPSTYVRGFPWAPSPGVRVAEAASLRVSDVDFMRGIVKPEIQYPAESLTSDASRSAVSIPQELALQLSADAKGGAARPWHGCHRAPVLAVGH